MKKLHVKYKNVIGIYTIINNNSNKIYIGSSNNLYKRINDHIRELNKNIHCNPHLQNAYNIDKDFFTIEVIATFNDIESIQIYEPLLIKLYQSNKPSLGYNILTEYRGTKGIKFTKERRNKISKSNKGRIAHNKGVPMSYEQKLLLRKINSIKRGKSILIYDTENQFIEELPSINEVIRKYNLDKRSVQRVLSGKYKYTKGLILKFKT